MNILQVLNENKKERLIGKFRTRLEGLFGDDLSLSENIIDNDPSATKKYSEWGIQKFLETVEKPSWNFENTRPNIIATIISTSIKNYHDIVESLSPQKVTKMFNFLELDEHFSSIETENKIKSKPKDINSFDTIQDLIYFFEKYEEFLTIAGDEKKIKEEVEKIYENDRFLIVRPLSHRSSCYYGANTQWCTTTRHSDDNFIKYTTSGKLYYIIDKKSTDSTYGKMALLINKKNNNYEIYNQKDDLVTLNFLLQRFEPIKENIIDLINNVDDYATLKRVKQNPKFVKQEYLKWEYFNRFIDDKAVFYFEDDIELYLNFFKDNVGDDVLGYYNWMYQNPNGDFFYESSMFDSDMQDGYPLSSLTSEHVNILKSIIEIIKPELLSSFENNGIKDDDLIKIAEFIEDKLPNLYKSFGYIYSNAEDNARHKGFLNYVESNICDIYKDIGLKKMEDSNCFQYYEISVEKLLEYYEENLELNKKLPVQQILENKVISNLKLDEYPNESNEFFDYEEFKNYFDDDMTNALKKELDRFESNESLVIDSKQYTRISNYIEKNFGFNTPHKIRSADEETIILFDSVDPKTTKVNFILVKDGEEKKGSAKLKTIIKLLNNYTLFDPF